MDRPGVPLTLAIAEYEGRTQKKSHTCSELSVQLPPVDSQHCAWLVGMRVAEVVAPVTDSISWEKIIDGWQWSSCIGLDAVTL